jgi:hypothetical protein
MAQLPPISDDDLFAELAALPERKAAVGRGRKSPLTLWLIKNRDRFAHLLASKRLAMDDIAEKLAAAGLLDGSGKPPTGARLRKTWAAINRPAGPSRRRRRPDQQQPQPAHLAAADLPAAPAAVAPADSAQKPKFQFRPSRMKDKPGEPNG